MDTRKFLFSLLLSLFTVFAVKAQVNEKLDAFNKVKVFGKIEVRLEKADEASILLESGTFDVEKVKFEVKDSTLELKLLYEFPPSIKVQATVYFTDLNEVVVNAGAKVYNKGEIEAADFNLEAKTGCELDLLIKTDSATVTVNKGAFVRLTGVSRSVKLKTATGGSYIATDLASENLYAKMIGGTAEVNVTEKLKAKVMFGGSLKYLQQPRFIDRNTLFKGTIGILEPF